VVKASSLLRGESRSCGCISKEGGDHAPGWKGGRYITRQGYAVIYSSIRKYVLQHRLVMEKQLGRTLLPDEVVHHKNGDRQDNRIENLELWSKSHPAGQRVEDLVRWAKVILERYSLFAAAHV
jgi:hypothetical protein